MQEMQKLLDLMARLRDPERGCSWDLKQDFASIAPYTLEEAYEVADAIERADWDDLQDELGDLLLQVVFHAQMAEEGKLFTFADVAKSINDKLIRRHPHVFEGVKFANDGERAAAWEAAKRAEKQQKNPHLEDDASVLAGITASQPALDRSVKLQKRAAAIGFDWDHIDQVLDKIAEELEEVREALAQGETQQIAEEIGDLLFAVTNLARQAKVDPEQALRLGNRKFERRFRALEQNARQRRIAMTGLNLEQLDRLWEEVKAEERALKNSVADER